jgi:GntR family transcriptional regulator
MGPQRFLTRPLYLQLRDVLVERIARGEWKPGDAVPNEIDLARELGVSQGTVRRSLDLLEKEHVVIRRQGRGTFVLDPTSPAQLGRYTNIFADNGDRVVGELSAVEVAQGAANQKERKLLLLPPAAEVYRLRRLRSYRGNPFLVEHVVLPVAMFPGVSEREWGSRLLAEIAPRYGVLLAGAVENVTLGVASAATATALHIREGTPVLILERLISTRDGKPAEWRHAECALGGLQYKVTM